VGGPALPVGMQVRGECGVRDVSVDIVVRHFVVLTCFVAVLYVQSGVEDWSLYSQCLCESVSGNGASIRILAVEGVVLFIFNRTVGR
jgi:homospermidine synthase